MGDKIIKDFQKAMQEGYSTKKAIRFLSGCNAQLIGRTGMNLNFSVKEKEDLYDFYGFFMKNYGDKTYHARMQSWGQEPFIFRLTEALYEQDEENKWMTLLDSASEEVLKEANDLLEKLFSDKTKRQLSYMDGNDSFTLEVPRSLDKDDRKLFLSICVQMIEKNGVIVLRIFGERNEPNRILSVRSDGKGHWIPVSKDVMKESHCTAPDDSKLQPEENLIYTEISR